MGDIYIQAREQTSRYGHCQEAVFENDGQLRKDTGKKAGCSSGSGTLSGGPKGAWHIHCIINDIGNTASLVERAWPYGGVYVTQIKRTSSARKRISRSWLITSPRMRKPGKRNKTEPWQSPDLVKQTTAIPGTCHFPEPKPEELKRWPKKVKPKKGYYIAELFEGKNPVTGYNYRHYTLIRLNRRI